MNLKQKLKPNMILKKNLVFKETKWRQFWLMLVDQVSDFMGRQI